MTAPATTHPDPPADAAGLAEVRHRARALLAEAEAVLAQIDPGWQAPPYDPLLIAQALGIRPVKVDGGDFHGALLCPRAEGAVILYRQHRDPARTRLALFHEIAHTLFPGSRRTPLPSGEVPPILEPEGRLERLCDVAALELMMPAHHFDADVAAHRFDLAGLQFLCQRYGADAETVALRMVDSEAAPACGVALIEADRADRWLRRQRGGGTGALAVTYAAYSHRGHNAGRYLRRQLDPPRGSCLRTAARSGKPATAREELPLLDGTRHPFEVAVLPLRDRPRRKGHLAVLALLQPA